MKKILNSADDVVNDYVEALVETSSHLARLHGWPVVVRSRATRKSEDRVALISGGGSGHEPAHGGYVGTGMLDAAVLGEIFTSPSVDSIYAAIRAVGTAAGTLLVVKNYTGDRLNFGLAAELARADGLPVEMVVVADDTALGDSSRAGRRGLSGTVLVHKIAGAAAERGWTLEQVSGSVNAFLDGAGTMGIALGPCHAPGTLTPNFRLAQDEVEWGLGIHGEPGLERGPLLTSEGIAERLITTIVDDKKFRTGDQVAVMVNGLGATPDLELRTLLRDVLRNLVDREIEVRYAWAGSFLTSLDMPGASLTIAKLTPQQGELIEDPVAVLAFPASSAPLTPADDIQVDLPTPDAVPAHGAGAETGVSGVHGAVVRLCHALMEAENDLTELDQEVGDGDLGTNLARGARQVLASDEQLGRHASAWAYFHDLSQIVRRVVGGTSGPLYSIFLLGLSEKLRNSTASPTLREWATGGQYGLDRIQQVGGAAPGDSTMVDALHPALAAFARAARDGKSAVEALNAAAHAAEEGAASTADLTPTLGRSSYVGGRAVGHQDPGAVAVALQISALATAVRTPA